MKKLTLISAVCLLLSAFPSDAWTITNVLIGVDSNSNAWSKVNANNGQYVSWLNQMTSTNNLLAVQQTGIASQYHVITNEMGVFLASGEMSFDSGQITSDGSGDLTVAGTASVAGGTLVITSGNAEFLGGSGVIQMVSGTAFGLYDAIDLGSDGSASFGGGNATIDPSGNITLQGHLTLTDGFNVDDLGDVLTSGTVTALSFTGAVAASQLTGLITNQVSNISGILTNGPSVWLTYKTNGLMGRTLTNLPWGTICTTSNGQMFVLSNMVWLLK